MVLLFFFPPMACCSIGVPCPIILTFLLTVLLCLLALETMNPHHHILSRLRPIATGKATASGFWWCGVSVPWTTPSCGYSHMLPSIVHIPTGHRASQGSHSRQTSQRWLPPYPFRRPLWLLLGPQAQALWGTT